MRLFVVCHYVQLLGSCVSLLRALLGCVCCFQRSGEMRVSVACASWLFMRGPVSGELRVYI